MPKPTGEALLRKSCRPLDGLRFLGAEVTAEVVLDFGENRVLDCRAELRGGVSERSRNPLWERLDVRDGHGGASGMREVIKYEDLAVHVSPQQLADLLDLLLDMGERVRNVFLVWWEPGVVGGRSVSIVHGVSVSASFCWLTI